MRRRAYLYLQGQTFFGLANEYRYHLFSEIHEICFHSKGGYDWNTVYNMPIWLRKFTFNKINAHYSEINAEIEEVKGLVNADTAANSAAKVNKPNIMPDKNAYVVKTTKKQVVFLIFILNTN